jgi:hypothetical protein
LIKVLYQNDDSIKVEFFEINSKVDLVDRYNGFNIEWDVKLPITVVEISYKVGGTLIEFGPKYTKIPGIYASNNFFNKCKVGICVR